MTAAVRVHLQRVQAASSYPVLFTRDAFSPGNPALARAFSGDGQGGDESVHVALYVDGGVAQAWPGLVDRAVSRLAALTGGRDAVTRVRVVPGGERIKNDPAETERIVRELLRPGFCRRSRVFVIGGGAVLDAVGFAASLVHRGLRVVRLPTTVLAQNDAGVGVKNGINVEGVKNAVGVFQCPHAVLIDFDFLRSLGDRDWRGGIAEAWKVALLKDAEFFDFLCREAEALGRRESRPMEVLVERCARLHLAHIADGGDPFELGSARPLDFGHWSAHALEADSGFRIKHGEAVAVGIALDTAYAVLSGWLDRSVFDRLVRGLCENGLPLWYPELERSGADGMPRLFSGMESFREHLGGRLSLTFPRDLGARREESSVDLARMREALRWLRGAAGGGTSADAPVVP